MDYLAACVGPELPPAVEIGAFTRSDISFGSLDPLESILEYLHEDYGDPDLAPLGSMTSRMEEAQERFLAVVRQEYVPYTCELAYTTTVDLPAHLTEHVPCSRCGKSFIWREVPDGRPSCPACRQRQ